uniref:Interferon-induced protein 44-like n=1 Tax=Crassostrea virginica TaxID=6565 RepID=A0A8B8BCS4_CRAVI|nr:interferon-induced protein 44-like [Crassostrea virginica]
MPELIKKSYRDELVTWIGRPCHFRLLYKFSRDGCSAQVFHQKCDGQGPTLTILYNTNSTIYGGYLSQSWTSNGRFFVDDRAFVFRLQYNGVSNPLKFPIKTTNNAGYGDGNSGPYFGNGDLQTFSGVIKRSRNYFPLNGSVRGLGNTFNLNGQSSNSITNNNLQVTDLEVYKVENECFFSDKPWRDHAEWSEKKMTELKDALVAYKPAEEADVRAANILLLGQIGAGKSTFFNSVNSIFRERITSKACSGSFEHSVTTMYRQYKIKTSFGNFLNFRLCDTRGFEEEFSMDMEEMSFILDGNIPDRYQFNPMVPVSSDTPGIMKNTDLDHKTHCVAFVIDASTADVMPDKVYKQMKDLQIKMNQRDIYSTTNDATTSS